MLAAAMTQQSNSKQLGLVFSIMLLDVIGLGVLIPTTPFIIRPFSHAAIWVTLVPAVYAGAQFLFAPVVGILSDKYGRKPLLLFSLAGSVFGSLMFGLGGSLAVLYAGRLVSGIASGNISIATAYLCDVSDSRDRAKNLTLVGIAYGVGYVVGPALGGVLGQFNPRAPVLVIAVLSAVVLVWVNLRFRDFSRASTTSLSMKHETETPIFPRMRELFANSSLILVLLVESTFYLGFTAFTSTGSLYFIEKFFLSPMQTGLLFLTSGLAMASVQAALVGPLVRRWGEKVVCAVGLAGTALTATAVFFVPVIALVYPTVFVLSGMAGLVFAPMGSLAVANAPEDQKGALTGFMTSISSLMAMVGPLLAGRIYDELGKGTPYLLGALFSVVSLALLARVASLTPQRSNVIPREQLSMIAPIGE